MSVLAAGASFVRFAAGIPRFVRGGGGIDDARRALRDGLERRDEAFLRTAATSIYGYDRSPYRRLLELAGCEYGDLADSVRRNGLEQTLLRLRDEGVYASFEEVKGRAPMVRGGRHIDVRPRDFANPATRGAVRSFSGGSTGPASQTAWSLQHLTALAVGRAVGYWSHGVLGVPSAVWRQTLPSPSGALQMLTDARFGQRYERWFAPSSPFGFPGSVTYTAATGVLRAAARLGSAPIPRPERADYDEPEIVAEWAAARARAGRVLVRTGISPAVRVATVARDRGLDLTGVTFVGAGEPATPAKARAVAASGAVHVPTYVSTEIGHMGIGCAAPASSSDVHLFEHAYAVVQHRRTVDGGGAVHAFLVTSLSGTAPTVALNLETDDYGVLEERDCGCPLSELGLRHHLRDVFSFGKLTGEGVTLVGTDLVRVLEEELPARFGGTPLDYQLVEEEDDHGYTKVGLVVSPRVAIDDENEVVDALLAGLGSTSRTKEARYIWQRRGTVVVRRRDPALSPRGKHQSLVRRGWPV